MTKKVFHSVFLSSVLILIASIGLIIAVLNNYFVSQEESVLAGQAALAAGGIETSGQEYLDTISDTDSRITWIAANGDVLYDNQADPSAMENHSEREEFKEALSNGTGTAVRTSSTLMERTIYYARKLTDGTVIRIAVTRNSLWLMLMRMITPFLWIVIGAVALSWLVAKRISTSVTEPLNHLDLDHPLDRKTYPELHPLLVRIDRQNKQITQQVEQLENSRKEFTRMTNAVKEGILLLDKDGRILSMNPVAEGIFSLNPNKKDKKGQKFIDLVPEHISKLVEHALSGTRDTDTLNRDDAIIRVNATPIMHDGVVTGAGILAYDVTEEQKAEQQRQEFTANVSHELKTPLQSIMGSAELLENHLVQEKDKDDFYQRIHRESSRLLTLIDDIIRLSQLDEHQEEPSQKVFLKDIVQEGIEAVQSSADGHQIAIKTDMNNAQVYAPSRMLYETAYNLLDNAVRYNKEGGRIIVKVWNDEENAYLSVEDNGIGIPYDAQSRIFERFYRVDKSHSRATGGTGLGLSIVKHAVESCNGKITVRSVPNEGSCFTVEYPKS